MDTLAYLEILKIIFLSTLSFVVAMLITPVVTHFLYKYKMGKQIRNNGDTPIFSEMHLKKAGTPTMGGVIVWLTVFIIIIIFFCLGKLIPIFSGIDFLSRSQTLLPLGALLASAFVGIFDDLLDIYGKGAKGGGGLRMRHRIIIYALIAVAAACWFYFKLDWDVLHIPFLGNYTIGWWIIPIFIFIIFATSFSVNETDGLDGLAGGCLLFSFAAYGIISFLLHRVDLAVFCGVICGALLAFLWFNIYPARFFMGDTGSMSLGLTLGIIAMLTNYALLLPIIGFIFLLESLSVILQISSRKLFGRKIFLSSPLHHHFEAKKWPEPKIVMRFWILSVVMAGLGIVLFLLDQGINIGLVG
jgi:phospho-N-acetylmuramoyl-pentapeptide-transferase